MFAKELKYRIAAMNNIRSENDYYALTLIATETGKIVYSICSHWVGFSDTKIRREIRAASIINPQWFAKYWKSRQVPYVVVNGEEDLMIYLLIGGNGLIEQKVVQKHLSNIVRPKEVGRCGPFGFKVVNSLPEQAKHKAPTPKLRMKVIQRDDYRCKICGRRAVDHVDIELHVHHIVPWKRGGLTEDKNLITLCHTCHKGLDPHENQDLFYIREPGKQLIDIDKNRLDLLNGIKRYRKKIQEM